MRKLSRDIPTITELKKNPKKLKALEGELADVMIWRKTCVTVKLIAPTQTAPNWRRNRLHRGARHDRDRAVFGEARKVPRP